MPATATPATPARGLYSVVSNGDGTITITGPTRDPLGAQGVWARTDAAAGRLQSVGGGEKAVTLPRGTERYVYIRGVSADDVPGKSLHVLIPE